MRAGTNTLELLWTNVTSADSYLLQVQPYELSTVPSKPKSEGAAIKADPTQPGECVQYIGGKEWAYSGGYFQSLNLNSTSRLGLRGGCFCLEVVSMYQCGHIPARSR